MIRNIITARITIELARSAQLNPRKTWRVKVGIFSLLVPLLFFSCKSNSIDSSDAKKGEKLVEDSVLSNVYRYPIDDWPKHGDESISFIVPSDFYQNPVSDTIDNSFMFNFYAKNDSGFFQLSIDSIPSDVNEHIHNELYTINKLEKYDLGEYCIEQIKLENGTIGFWKIQSELVFEERLYFDHSFYLVNEDVIIKLSIFLPSTWDQEEAVYLLYVISAELRYNSRSIYSAKTKITNVDKQCY